MKYVQYSYLNEMILPKSGFHSMIQSFKDLNQLSWMFLALLIPKVSTNFRFNISSSRKPMVKNVAYVGAILVPIAIPEIWK